MTDDILAQAEEACKLPYYNENDLMRDENWQRIFERCNLLPLLLAEAKAWKAKVIEERAMQKSRFCNDNLDEMRDFWMHDMDDSSKNKMIELAARELEEEMQNG